MRQTLCAWIGVAASAAAFCLVAAVDARAQQPAPRPIPGLAVTNTNKTAAANEEVVVKVAKPPGKGYTNCVGMQLVQVGDFWAGKYEVTQAEYRKIMGANPSAFQGDMRPVDSVSWNDAMEFCRRLTEKDIASTNLPSGYSYSLPTESQWESLVADASPENAVTSLGSHRDATEQVGSLGPNSLGLYDVRGNVMEFTLDHAQPYRVLRGGSWQDFIEVNLRPVFRYYCQPDDHKNTFGFRCVLLKQPAQ